MKLWEIVSINKTLVQMNRIRQIAKKSVYQELNDLQEIADYQGFSDYQFFH
jgi:hypothetical protein